MTKILVDREVIHAAIDALESVERLIEHQYTGTRDGMAYLQNTADDAQVMLGELRTLLDQPDAPRVEPLTDAQIEAAHSITSEAKGETK